MLSDPQSFAHYTMMQRWTAIGQRVLTDHPLPPDRARSLQALIAELPQGQIRLLRDEGADRVAWDSYLAPYVGKTWAEMPWWVAEVYFYRRLLEATGYFQPGDWHGVDPFWASKQQSLETAMTLMPQLWPAAANTQPDRSHLQRLFHTALWGNQIDLSLKPRSLATQTPEPADDRLLVDDTAAVIDRLWQERPQTMDLIADNAGIELVCDLCLIDALLEYNITHEMYVHLKAHPTFVSDATIPDALYTLETLAAHSDAAVQALATRLQNYLVTDRLFFLTHPFWTAPLPFWELPAHLKQEMAQSGLVVIKGDANYRRLLGDRQWPFTTPFADITSYFPAPFLALRSLKAELAAGLTADQIARLNQTDPEWLTNGNWGVIQQGGLA